MFLKALCKIRLRKTVELILSLHFKTHAFHEHISVVYYSLILELVSLYNETQFVSITYYIKYYELTTNWVLV